MRPEPAGHGRKYLSTQAHPQSHMEIPRPQNGEPDRPYLNQPEVQEVMAGCEGAERCRRVIRPLPGCDSSKAPAEEIH